ncbi:MAG: SH3 domain-containing protein [Clostridia bacterium]|nr:SH3 domain-containing protein [Clostridia bacterium]
MYRYNRPAADPVKVVIHYVSEDGQTVATDTKKKVDEGTWPVSAAPKDLQDYYELVGDASQDVTVDYDGAHPAEVTFVYHYNRPAADPVKVVIHYVSEDGQPVASDTKQKVEEGTWPVSAAPKDLQDYYELVGEASQDVTVDYDGAHPAEVTFVYRYNRPAADPVRVVIHYVSEDGQTVATDTKKKVEEGTWPVSAAPKDLQDYYELVGDASQDVTVDYDGAHPAEVTFVYAYVAPEPEETATPEPTAEPTPEPTEEPTPEPTAEPTPEPTEEPTPEPTAEPTPKPTEEPTPEPTAEPTPEPTEEPTPEPTAEPTPEPTEEPTPEPTAEPTPEPTEEPTPAPTDVPATPAPQPVAVVVRYVDQDGRAVADDDVVECAFGTTEIIAAPRNLLDDYELDGPDQMTVQVDENGATPAQVEFVYRYDPEVPAPKVALVGVKYVRPDGESFYAYTETCQEGVENKITLDWTQVDPGWNYELASDEEVLVTVDSNGVATPGEVVFKFKNEVNAFVTVRYQDIATGRDVATSQQILCYVGNNIIDAQPHDLDKNYQLAPGEETSRGVTLSRDGTLSPEEIVFHYTYLPTPTPLPATPTPLPFDTPLDGYGYPAGNGINFRSSPTTAENNIITRVRNTDLAKILGQVKNAKNETWYAVEIDGQVGYLKDSVFRVLTDAEVAALFHYTPAPTNTPKKTATPVPDGVIIDRWGTTNAKVNFRRTPETINNGKNANKISELKKNAQVWVYSSLTQNGNTWYFVRVNGVDGYLVSRYVDLMSKKNSQAIQDSLVTPMATQLPPATPTPVPTAPPTPSPLPTETIVPLTPPPEILETPVPAAYRGYALTRNTTALRTGVSQTDDTILEVLPDNALVYVSGQTYVDGVAWSSVEAVASNNYGFILHDALQTISNEEAKYYLDALQPAVVVTATPVPVQVYGYGMTVGEGVPLRAFPDTNAAILDLLPYAAVASVQGQSFENGSVWHVVQYNGMWGFIRDDQLRILSEEESAAYEQSLLDQMQTPEPIIEITPEPVTENSLSSYGHVTSNSGKVNLRSEPSTGSNRVRLLDNYAFALVLGTVTNEEGLWYHVSQAGTEGYIAGSYFKVLSLGELTEFLQSDDYLNANGDGITGNDTSANIQPVEDYNQTVWQNPALSPSYEPFNPYATATPDPERIVTPTPAPTSTPEPTAQIAPVGPEPEGPTAPETTRQGGSAWPWVLLALAAVGGGGAYYAYTLRRKNEKRRQAMRAQQARQNRTATAQQPQMRAASNNPNAGQTAARPAYTSQSAPFMPPQGGVPRPAQRPAGGQNRNGVSQGTTAYQPVRPNGQQGSAPAAAPVKQATQTFSASQLNQANAAPRQDTQAFSANPLLQPKPVSAPAKQETLVFNAGQLNRTSGPVPQDTQVFNASQVNQAKQETLVFSDGQFNRTAAPVKQPAAAAGQETQVFTAGEINQAKAAVKQETQVFSAGELKQAAAPARQETQTFNAAELKRAAALPQQQPQIAGVNEMKRSAPAADSTTGYQRRRRSDRHQNADDGNA